MTTDDDIADQALAWLALQDDVRMDWLAFTAWLEADPRHRKIYDELALIDSDLTAHRVVLRGPSMPVHAVGPNRQRSWRTVPWIGGAVAASLAAVMILQPVSQVPMGQDYRAARTMKAVALRDGTRVTLSPGSHLAENGNAMSLEGSAFFDVPHRPGRTLTVAAGDFSITDIGTRFSVTSEPGDVSVDVAEGSLTVKSTGLERPIALKAGQGIIADDKSGAIRRTKLASDDVAGWRNGKLQFNEMRLALVARRISRYSGVKLTVDPAIADRTFSGVIAIEPGASPAKALAQILALDVAQEPDGLRLRARGQP